MDEDRVLTTDEDFALFKKEVEAWIKEFGLYDWEIEYLHTEEEDARARCNWCGPHKLAQMILSKDWTGAELNPEQICLAAFHETLELLISEVTDMANNVVSEEDINNRTHTLIHRLQRVMFKPKSIAS